MSDTQPSPQTPENGAEQGQQQEQAKPETFTQADVDKIVKERIARERARFSDYDDLKAKAGEKATVEDRLAAMEKRAMDAETRALRNDVATRHGISAEDRDLFLTGTSEETLDAQAKRLAERESERKKASNVVPREGNNPKPGTSDVREFTRGLFAGNNP
jgi:hypothetical protein